jgi:TetR/AcrR family transcriptional regulator
LLKTLPPAKVTRAAVARHAGVDPNLIRYYFKDRDSLLLAVLEQVIEERSLAAARETQGSAADNLRAHIRAFFAFNATYPFFHRLLVEEIATLKSTRARQAFHKLNQVACGRYAELLKNGSKDKTLRKGDAALLHIAVIGMSEFYLGSRVLLEDVFGKGTTPSDYAERYGDMIADLVVDGLRQR